MRSFMAFMFLLASMITFIVSFETVTMAELLTTWLVGLVLLGLAFRYKD